MLGSTRRRLPFGIAQQGKSFRNEITPGNFIFRTREFEQMEMEFFVDPADSNEWYERWIELREAWYHDLGIRPENLRRDVHSPESLSHYSAGTTDLQYRFPWGWDELEGIANRTDFDLTQHGESSGKRLDYFDQAADKHVIPHVIEPAVGVDRIMLALLCDAYRVIPDEKGDARVVLALEPRMAPVTVAVLPLSRKQPVADLAREVWDQLRPHWTTQYDDTQSIGRRYRRQDEIGTPWCVTDRLRIPRRQRRNHPPPRHPKAGPAAHRRASERTPRPPRLLTRVPCSSPSNCGAGTSSRESKDRRRRTFMANRVERHRQDDAQSPTHPLRASRDASERRDPSTSRKFRRMRVDDRRVFNQGLPTSRHGSPIGRHRASAADDSAIARSAPRAGRTGTLHRQADVSARDFIWRLRRRRFATARNRRMLALLCEFRRFVPA